MKNSERAEKIFSALRGRKIQDIAADLKDHKLHVLFEDGIIFTLWVDDEAYLCFDVDREARH